MINQNNLQKEMQEVQERLRQASLAMGVSLQSVTDAFRSVSQSASRDAQNMYWLSETLGKHAEEMRWRHDPLEIQARFIDPVVADLKDAVVWGLRALSEGLGGLADWVEGE